MSDTAALDRVAWDRRGWIRDGVRTYPVALAMLGGAAGLAWLLDALPASAAPAWLRLLAAVGVIGLVVLARELVRRVLSRRGRLVMARWAASDQTVLAYAVLAAAVAGVVGGLDAEPFGIVLGALAMTAPGVLLVVLDGSPPLRGLLRVLLAVALVPVAVVGGLAVGFLAFFVSTFVGSFVFGFLAGHLLTFVPLALVGPGPARVDP